MPSLNAMAKAAKNTKSSTAPKKFTKIVVPTANLSTEFVQESDLEADEKSQDTSSSGDEESLPENPATAAPKSSGNVATAVDSGSESSEGSDSDDDEDEEPSKSAKKLSRTLEFAKSQPPQPSTRTAPFNKTSLYKPPVGFDLTSLNESSQASQLLKKSNLEGKQIWYITAPASIPISSIKETSLEKIKKSSAVISHNENSYGFIEDPSEDMTYTKIMVPHFSNEGYCAGAKPIDRILHLQQIVQLPSVYDANAREAASSSTAGLTVSAKKPVRQQPPGLKMRFRPIGFGNGSTGTIGSSSSSADENITDSASDEEMEDALPQFQRPASVEQEESSTSSDSLDDEMTDAPPLLSKPIAPSKPQKSAAKDSSKVADHTLKRKHSEGGDLNAKTSSSSSAASVNNKQLNPVKKKQKTSQTDSHLASAEAHKTTSSAPFQPLLASSTPIPPPTSKRNRPPSSSSHNFSFPVKTISVLQSKPQQMSSSRNSQVFNVHSNFKNSKKASERLSTDPQLSASTNAVDLDSSTKGRKKEAKRLKKENSKLLSKSERESDAVKITSVPPPSRDFAQRDGSTETSSSQTQNTPAPILGFQEKHHSESVRKEKKKKKADMDNGREKGSVPKVHGSTPILPPARSHSTIRPPQGTPSR